MRPARAERAARLALVAAALAIGCQSPFDAQRTWLRLENAHLVVFSLAEEEETRETAEALESFRSATSALLRLRRPADAPKLAVLIVDDPYELGELCGRRGLAGCYGKGPSVEAMAMLAGLGDEPSRQVVRHEYVHALVENHAWSLPTWFEEGLAELLSTLEVEVDELVIGRPPENAADIVRRRSFRPLSTVLRRGSMQDRDTTAYFQYWTLVRHWYVETPDREALNRYLERCHAGEDWIDAFEPSFGMPPDTYWRREVMPALGGGTIRVKRVSIRRPPPDLAFAENSATGTEVAAYLRSTVAARDTAAPPAPVVPAPGGGP